MTAENTPSLTAELLSALAENPEKDAIQLLRDRNLDDANTMLALATIALDDAETDPALSLHWLAICRTLNQSILSKSVNAQIAYAQARLDLQNGDLGAAEQNIAQAQSEWQKSDDRASIARSNIGLTQIFAMQGRYDEAENAIQQAINYFTQSIAVTQSVTEDQSEAENDSDQKDLSISFRLIGAKRNLANLYGYQERHEAALVEFANLSNLIDQIQSEFEEDSEAYQALQYERAHGAISESISFSHLDQIDKAESTLLAALAIFEQQKDDLYRGRVFGNLGSLYLRTGRYADALAAFEQSTKNLSSNDVDPSAADEQNLFDVAYTLLEQSTAYIALNLLPEAENSLLKCESIFRQVGSETADSVMPSLPHELGRTLYALGQVYARLGDLQQANRSIVEAEQIFKRIANHYWLNRCLLALSTIAYLQNEKASAIAQLDNLIAASEVDNETNVDLAATNWDISLLTELRLLRLRMHLDANEIDRAQEMAVQVELLISADNIFPHLQLRLIHARGQIAQANGEFGKARGLFLQAIDLLELQRTTLAVEEVRSAFITDKTDIYTDLVLNLLTFIDEQLHDGVDTESDELISELFGIIERARSRTLLERLLASFPDDSASDSDSHNIDNSAKDSGESEGQISQREKLRRELHWLYNRLLGQDGVRRTDIALTQQISTCEAELQKLEWQVSPALQQADPVELSTLQQALASDQQAIVYYIANDEVMAFIVGQNDVEFVRQLCTKNDLFSALRDLRFQLGRFQVGGDYVQRHAERLQRGIDDCLRRLHHLLLQPLIEHLILPRVQIIPFGMIHLIPFHALLGAKGYFVEQFECTYAPSASVAVTTHNRSSDHTPYTSLAALGITDELIPEVRTEVEFIAQHFETVHTYLDERANRENLGQAASEADILHIATHGLYRSDNPFFSSLKLADGWIDVREIYRLNLHARLVVLSACESGAGYVLDGDEVIGLARGFIGAGAHALMVSMWNVHDATAAHQMDSFYNALQNDDDSIRPAAALRKAQLNALEQGQHPYYWAPFAVIG